MTTLHQDQSQDGWDDNETCSFHDGGKMAFWPLPCPRVDSFERDTSFFWQDLDGHAEGSTDFFGQFLNFDSNDGQPTNAQGIPSDSMSPNPGLMPRLQDPRSLDQPPRASDHLLRRMSLICYPIALRLGQQHLAPMSSILVLGQACRWGKVVTTQHKAT